MSAAEGLLERVQFSRQRALARAEPVESVTTARNHPLALLERGPWLGRVEG